MLLPGELIGTAHWRQHPFYLSLASDGKDVVLLNMESLEHGVQVLSIIALITCLN